MNNYSRILELCSGSWVPESEARFITIIQREKDRNLRSESDFWEIKEYYKEEKHPNAAWQKHIATFPVWSEDSLKASEKTVTTICNAFGARAYFTLEPRTVSAFTSRIKGLTIGQAALDGGLFDVFASTPFAPIGIVPGTVVLSEKGPIYSGASKWEEDKWYLLDCDSLEGGGETEDWKKREQEAIEYLKSIVTVTRLEIVPSNSGEHICFQMKQKKFPEKKWSSKFGTEAGFHADPQLVLYRPKRRYFLTSTQPRV